MDDLNDGSDCDKNRTFSLSAADDSDEKGCPASPSESIPETPLEYFSTDEDDIHSTYSRPLIKHDAEVSLQVSRILENVVTLLPIEYQDLYQTDPHTSLRPSSQQPNRITNETSIRPRSVRSAADMATPEKSVGLPLDQPDYMTMHVLGEGGMGTVHLARQVALGRAVALKQIQRPYRHDRTVQADFITEAVLTGKLEHPNIVPIYEVGKSLDGELFYSMKNIKGRAWSELIGELSLNDNLNILDSVCDAIAFAHAQGVIHRDLKPQNIMTGAFGEVLVLDWGLALPLNTSGEVDASFGGTPCFMAPEMVILPNKLDQRTDIYLLGGILFLILTGKAPHGHKNSARDCVEAAAKNHILKPDDSRVRMLDPSGELLAVALHALAADRKQRYQTVKEFQQAIRNYQAHRESLDLSARAQESLEQAKSTGDYAQFSKALFGFEEALKMWDQNALAAQGIPEVSLAWALRAEQQGDFDLALSLVKETNAQNHEIRARVSAARVERDSRQQHIRRLRQIAFMTSIAVAVLAIVAAVWINSERTKADDERAKAVEAQGRAEQARRESVTNLADMQTQRGLMSAEQGNAAEAALWFVNAARLTPHDTIRQATNELRSRNWLREAAIPLAFYDVPGGNSHRLEPQPNGSFVLTLNVGGLNIRDAYTSMTLPWADSLSGVSDASWSPSGKQIAVGFDSGEVQIREHLTGTVVQNFTRPEKVEILQWSPNGQRLAVAGSQVDVWNLRDSPTLEVRWQHPKRVYSLTFNNSGSRLVTACDDDLVRVFAVEIDSKQPAPIFPPVEHLVNKVISLGYRPSPVFCDGDRKLVTASNGFPHWWNAETGEDISPAYTAEPDNFALRLTASPDGHWVAAAGDRACLIANANGESIAIKHSTHVIDVAFDPTSKMLMTTSMDQKARLWSLQLTKSNSPMRPILTIPQLGTFRRCAFARDGSFVAIGGYNSTTAIWTLPSNDVIVGHAGGKDAYTRMRPSFDGQIATTGAWHETWSGLRLGENRLRVVRMMNGEPAGPTIGLSGRLLDSCVCFDNRTIAAACVNGVQGSLSLHDISTGAAIGSPVTLPSLPRSVAARPGSAEVAVLCVAGQLNIYNAQTGALIRELHEDAPFESSTSRVLYSPNGDALVTATASNTVSVRDADSGEMRFPPINPVVSGGPIRSFDISSDSRLIAIAVNGNNSVRVWNLETGEAAGPVLQHPGDFIGIFTVAFSPDNRSVLTAHTDGRLRLWDWKAGTLVCPPMEHGDQIYEAEFTGDGKYAIAANRHGGVTIWDLTSAKLVAPPIRYPLPREGSTQNLAVSGLKVIAGAAGHPVLDLSLLLHPSQLKIDEVQILTELSANQQLELGEQITLEQSEWNDRWELFCQIRSVSTKKKTIATKPEEIVKSVSPDTHTFDQELARLTTAVDQSPETVAPYYARGVYLMQLGRWSDSVKDFSHARDLNRHSPYEWMWVATSLIMAGDDDGYRQHCQDMVREFQSIDVPNVADIVCKVALLKPDVVKLDELPIQRIRDAAADPELVQLRPYFAACCALISHREGKPQQAIEWANKAGERGPPGTLALLVKAMSEHKLTKAEQAKASLEKAEANIPLDLRTLGHEAWSGTLPASKETVGFDLQIAEIIRREAAAMIAVKTSSNDNLD